MGFAVTYYNIGAFSVGLMEGNGGEGKKERAGFSRSLQESPLGICNRCVITSCEGRVDADYAGANRYGQREPPTF